MSLDDRTLLINLRETQLFITTFLNLLDQGGKIFDMPSAQRNLLKYAWAELPVELIDIAEKDPVDLSKCTVFDAEGHKLGQAYLTLSILAKILSNPRVHIWGNSDDTHLRTIITKLKISFGESQSSVVIEKLLNPVFASMKGEDNVPYKLEIMEVLLEIISSISYLDKLRFLGFVQETIMIDKKLSESGEAVKKGSLPYILSYKEHGLHRKVAMGI